MQDRVAFTRFSNSSLKRPRPIRFLVFVGVFGMIVGFLFQYALAADKETQPISESAKQFLHLAEQGNTEAQYKVGKMYEEGLGGTQDYQMAAKWYLKAAEKGDGQAQYKMGTMYTLGRGVPRDIMEAARWFGKAAQQGYEPVKRQIQETGGNLKDQLLKDPLGMFQRKTGG